MTRFTPAYSSVEKKLEGWSLSEEHSIAGARETVPLEEKDRHKHKGDTATKKFFTNLKVLPDRGACIRTILKDCVRWAGEGKKNSRGLKN